MTHPDQTPPCGNPLSEHELRARLISTQAEMALLQAQITQGTESDPLRAALFATLGALAHDERIYQTQLRALRPIEVLGVTVGEDIASGEST